MPTNFTVVESVSGSGEAFVVGLSPRDLRAAGLRAGDYVRAGGKRRRFTVCIVAKDNEVEQGDVRMSTSTRLNLRFFPVQFSALYLLDFHSLYVMCVMCADWPPANPPRLLLSRMCPR